MTLPAEERAVLGLAMGQHCLAAFEDGELVGTLGGYDAEMTLPGAVPAPVLVLDDVAVLPTHRRRGVLSALLGRSLEQSRDAGIALAALHASEGGIYGRFGFAPSCFAARYRLRRGAELVHEAAGRVRLLRVEEAIEAFPPVFDEARLARAGEVSRRPGAWSELIGAGGPSRFLVAYLEPDSPHDRVDGYAVYELVDPGGARDPGRPLAVSLLELQALTPGAYAGLWSYLAGIDLTEGVRTTERPVDEPLRHVLRDPRELATTALVDRAWLRIVDAETALAARRYRAAGALVLLLRDERCPWNEAALLVEVDTAGVAGAKRIARADPPPAPALELDAGALAAAYLGGTSFATLVAAGRAQERHGAAVELADLLFGAAPAPFCTDL